MQLGVRWRCGEAPHRSVPAALHETIAAVETRLAEAGALDDAAAWTLTWLEGRPSCRCAGRAGDLAVVGIDASGRVTVVGGDRLGDPGTLDATGTALPGPEDEEDDDAWLN